MNITQWVEDLALGAVLGGIGGLLGIGGGLIAIPVLVLVYHYDQQTAQGTALVMIVPNVLIGFWRARAPFTGKGAAAAVLRAPHRRRNPAVRSMKRTLGFGAERMAFEVDS